MCRGRPRPRSGRSASQPGAGTGHGFGDQRQQTGRVARARPGRGIVAEFESPRATAVARGRRVKREDHHRSTSITRRSPPRMLDPHTSRDPCAGQKLARAGRRPLDEADRVRRPDNRPAGPDPRGPGPRAGTSRGANRHRRRVALADVNVGLVTGPVTPSARAGAPHERGFSGTELALDQHHVSRPERRGQLGPLALCLGSADRLDAAGHGLSMSLVTT